MEDRVKQFLASGKLEEYVFGILDPNDQAEVLSYIKKYPEVNNEYVTLQNQLETISKKQSLKPPPGMKAQILDALPDKIHSHPQTKISWMKYLAALSMISAILFAWGWKKSIDHLQLEKVKYATLESDCEERQNEIKSQKELIAFLNAEQTQRFELQGNKISPDFNAMVFVNESLGKGIITPRNVAILPKNKCLQLWGDLDGEMIPIAVLDNVKNKEYNLDIDPRFTSLNLTIEDKTQDGKGQLHPDVSQLIASVVI